MCYVSDMIIIFMIYKGSIRIGKNKKAFGNGDKWFERIVVGKTIISGGILRCVV